MLNGISHHAFNQRQITALGQRARVGAVAAVYGSVVSQFFYIFGLDTQTPEIHRMVLLTNGLTGLESICLIKK